MSMGWIPRSSAGNCSSIISATYSLQNRRDVLVSTNMLAIAPQRSYLTRPTVSNTLFTMIVLSIVWPVFQIMNSTPSKRVEAGVIKQPLCFRFFPNIWSIAFSSVVSIPGSIHSTANNRFPIQIKNPTCETLLCVNRRINREKIAGENVKNTSPVSIDRRVFL